MGSARRVRVLVAWCALVAGPAAAAGMPDVVPDLEKVEGIKQFDGPPAARELLKRNGFVVVPRFYHQIFSPYIHSRLPPFITTDSLHRTFHVIFEEQIKRVETALAADVEAITKAMLERIAAVPPSEAQRLAHGYFQVAKRLLAGGEAAADAPEEVAAELAFIRAATSVGPSPLFGYKMDYSQFKPRGFYTETPLLQRYFRAMSWYGNAAFRIVSDRETRAAMLIAERFAADKGTQERWRKADRLYTHLIAPADDLTPEEYARLIRLMGAKRLVVSPLAWFKQAAAGLRDPKINSMVLTPDEMPRWRELGKGMRFFGKRYLPDSEVFMDLVHPSVPERLWPSGLDVMAALGSARAREIQDSAGETKRKGYEQGFAASCKTLDNLLAVKESSHYVETLKLARTLLAPPGPEALPFMRTPAYADKNLMTALALWTSLRHTWQLQAKQSAGVGWGEPEAGPPPGWVEPNFPFYEQLHRLITRTLEVVGPVEAEGTAHLKALDALVLKVLAIGRRQAAGEALTPEDRCFFESEFTDELESLHGTYFAPSSWMSLVADVHSELFGEGCLEEGIGGAMPIFVVIPRGEKQYLMVGGAYSHYEFRQPIAQRLTDEEWRDRVSSGNLPPIAPWAGSFVAGFDVVALLKRIGNGQEEDDVLFVNDPAVETFLEKAVEPGGLLDGKPNLPWAVEMLGTKAGKKALPKLLDYFLNPRGPKEWRATQPDGKVERREFQAGGPRAEGASRVLGHLAEPEHLPLFEKVAREGDVHRAESAVEVIADMRDKEAEGSLVKIAQDASAGGRGDAVRYLGWQGSRDVTPALLELWGKADEDLQECILEALARIWAEADPEGPADDSSARWESQIGEPTAGELRKKVRSLALAAITDPSVPDYAIEGCVGRLKLREAIPILETQLFARDPHCALNALSLVGGHDAARALLRLSYLVEGYAPHDCDLGDVLRALAKARSALAAPRALEILARTKGNDAERNDVSQNAVEVLNSLCPDGPEWPAKADAADMPRLAAEWKEHLKKRGIPTEAQLSQEDAASLAAYLMGRAQHYVRPADPARAIASLLAARRLLGGRADAAATQKRKEIEKNLVAVARAEVYELACGIRGELSREESFFGRDRQAIRLTPLVEALDGTVRLDAARATEKGYLDPWGNPYQYLKPGKHSKEPFEIYSFGPNGKDEDGGGDDIVSWKQD